jgi:plasmid stabilization system protein ParE
MRLDYTSQALADLEAIADYLTPLNPQAATRARAAILDLLQKLVIFPHLGRSQTAKDVRTHCAQIEVSDLLPRKHRG